MATIKEVAKLAGVSISTVSRALSQKVFVEEATRQKVLKAVKQLSYKPNLMAKGLKEGHSKTLALVLPDILNPYFPTMVKYLERYAAEKGYSIILYDSGEDAHQEKRAMEGLRSHYVDGVIYVPNRDDLTMAHMLIEHNIPVMVLNRDADHIVPTVSSDNYEGARAVINYLVKNGHRKIACFASDLELNRYRSRYEGCVAAFRENNIDDFKRYLVKNINTIDSAYKQARKILSKPDRPTAVFVFFDMMAMGVYSGAHDCGLRVPEDVSVAGFDNIYLSQHLIPPLTTYEQPMDKMAKIAMNGLIGQIENPSRPRPESAVVKGSLLVRKSVASL